MTNIRSFYEHPAVDTPQARSIINGAAWPWRLLFLNLNELRWIHTAQDFPTDLAK